MSIHPGVSIDDVVANTGFPLIVPEKVKTTPPPTKEQLRYIREVIDPERWFTG
jgi:glutaconate CoA-transferase subunit B